MGTTGGSGRRRGRPQRLPDDPIPLSSSAMTVDHRIAWLLATTRILHPDEALSDRAAFSAAAAALGLKIDATRISRWETGTTAVSPEVVEAYETVLGRPAGSLAAVIGGLRRTFGEEKPRRPKGDDELGTTPSRLLDDALDGHPMTGGHWQQISDGLTAYSSFYLRRPEWDLLAGRLIAELSRATGMAYVRRYETAATLIRHPSAQRHVSRAIGRFVMDPHTQVVLPVLQLLTEVDDEAAGLLVMRMMGDDNKDLRRAASSVAAVKLRRSSLPDDGLRQLEAYAAHTLRRTSEPLDGGLDAFDVTTHLPKDAFDRVLAQIPDRRVQAMLGRSRSTGELIPRQQAAAVVADLAAAVQADESDFARHPEPDMMLRRLLRESLFHIHKSRRHQAALLLTASPYRHAVARQCQDLVGGSNYFLAARAWTVLMRVGHAGSRPQVLLRAMSEARPTLRSRALVNIGLDEAPLGPGEAQALVTSIGADERRSVRHGLVFCLGMNGSPLLDDLAAHAAPALHRPARWWQQLGPAIHET